MGGRTVYDRLDALDIGLPGAVGTTMGVRYLNPEDDALTAEITFGHSLHLPAIETIQVGSLKNRKL